MLFRNHQYCPLIGQDVTSWPIIYPSTVTEIRLLVQPSPSCWYSGLDWHSRMSDCGDFIIHPIVVLYSTWYKVTCLPNLTFISQYVRGCSYISWKFLRGFMVQGSMFTKYKIYIQMCKGLFIYLMINFEVGPDPPPTCDQEWCFGQLPHSLIWSCSSLTMINFEGVWTPSLLW